MIAREKNDRQSLRTVDRRTSSVVFIVRTRFDTIVRTRLTVLYADDDRSTLFHFIHVGPEAEVDFRP